MKKNPTIMAPSMVTMQKLEWQGMQKSKEPGVNEERTQVSGGNLIVVVEILDQDQGTFPGEGVTDMEVDTGLAMATMGMVESLEVATLEITLVMEEKEENTGVEAWIRQTGVGQWRWS